MISCLRTRVHKQPIVVLYFESETVLKFYNLKARSIVRKPRTTMTVRQLVYKKAKNHDGETSNNHKGHEKAKNHCEKAKKHSEKTKNHDGETVNSTIGLEKAKNHCEKAKNQNEKAKNHDGETVNSHIGLEKAKNHSEKTKNHDGVRKPKAIVKHLSHIGLEKAKNQCEKAKNHSEKAKNHSDNAKNLSEKAKNLSEKGKYHKGTRIINTDTIVGKPSISYQKVRVPYNHIRSWSMTKSAKTDLW